MNTEELVNAIQKLRDFASANGMQWILDEVDEAVSLGIPETRTLRQSSKGGRVAYEDVTGVDVGGTRTNPKRRRAEEFVSRRALTELEQIELLVQALRRVLVDLDEIANDSIEALNDRTLRQQMASTDDAWPESFQDLAPSEITGISFAPDEGSRAPAINTDSIRYSDRRAHVSEILDRIENEIRS